MESATPSEFIEAVRAILGERCRRLSSHPTFEELEVYHRGDLAAERREAVVEHLAVCETCTLMLLYGIINGDTSAASEIGKVWDRIRRLLPDDAPTGTPLKDLLADGWGSVKQTLPVALEVSRKLAELHAKGRVLNDLRAENILIDSSGHVRILATGFIPTPESFELGCGRSAEEVVGNLFSSLSPEQIAREGVTERSNLFSFGVLFYEMLSGESPFRGVTPLETASRILSLDPLPIEELNSEVGPGLAALIDRLLAKSPEDRPPSATAVARELEAILERTESTKPSEEAIDDEIEDLYDEIIALTQEETADRGSRGREAEIDRAYARLLELQTAEAERHRQQFEARLNMPIDAGEKILDRMRALREELEGLATDDPTADNSDHS